MEPLRSAVILAVGSELLSPFRTDTNSLAVTAELNAHGIAVREKSVVPDDVADLAAACRRALALADLVVFTGGLGPTADDVTRDAVAAAIGIDLVEDPALVAAIAARFARRQLAMPESNRRQALVPPGAVVLRNTNGTAPGLWIERGEQVLLLLPGPPRELTALLEAEVRPRLAARAGGRVLRRRVIRTTGRPESFVDEIASPIYLPWMSATPAIETTILAVSGQIELHLGAAGENRALLDHVLNDATERLARALGPIVISTDGRSLEAVVGERLRDRGFRIACAESCTAGLLLARLTDVPGSSAWVVGGIVAYDNAVKVGQLGVPQALLDSHGAVSESVAAAMADGVRARLGADVGVAITGIAGPSGGTPAKPVGTVVIAVAGPVDVVRTFAFAGDRRLIRHLSVQAALDMVRRAWDAG